MPAIPQKITPNLWFDSNAEEAAQFYTSLFEGSSIDAVTRYGKAGFEIHGRPEGSVMTVEFNVGGYHMTGINGGPFFKFTPAISLYVIGESEAEVDRLWNAFMQGGQALMPLQEYPWSKKYGWLQDRFGLTWQLTLGDVAEVGQKISPVLMFTGPQHGRAEEAMQFYTKTFRNSKVDAISRYMEGEGDTPGTIKHARFTLSGETFMAMDSGYDHKFNFNEAFSLLVTCESQEEIDFFWDHLSEGGDPAAQQCGWLKDKFGVSWQVAPAGMNEMLLDPDRAKVERLTEAYLKMKKFDLAALQRAFDGR